MTWRTALLGLTVALLLALGFLMFAQRTRTFEGTWIDLFEGSSFFENQTVTQACGDNFHDAAWLLYRRDDQSIEHDTLRANRASGTFTSEHGTWPIGVYTIRFVGRKKFSLLDFGFGHLGSFGSEVEVQRMVSMKPIPGVRCDIR